MRTTFSTRGLGAAVMFLVAAGTYFSAYPRTRLAEQPPPAASPAPAGALEVPYLPGEHVDEVAFSRDGSRVATAATDGRVLLYDTCTGEAGPILLTAPDGAFARLGRYDWDPRPRAFHVLAISEDGTRIARAWRSEVLLWDATSGALERVLEGGSDRMTAVALSSDGRAVAAGDAAGEIRVWDALTGTPRAVLRPPAAPAAGGTTAGGLSRLPAGSAMRNSVWSLALSPDGSIIAASFLPDQVAALSTADGSVLWQAPYAGAYGPYPADVVAFSPDGQGLAIWAAGSLAILNTRSGTAASYVSGQPPAAFSPDGRALACASRWSNEVATCDLRSGKEGWRGNCEEHVLDIAFTSGGGITVATGSDLAGFQVRAFTPPLEQAAFAVPATPFCGVAFFRDGRALQTWGGASPPGWGPPTPLPSLSPAAYCVRPTAEMKGPPAAPTPDGVVLAIAPDRRTLAAATTGGTIELRDTATGARLRSLASGCGRVGALAFSPDGRLLAVQTRDPSHGPTRLTVWDVRAGARLGSHPVEYPPGEPVFAFIPGGSRLALGRRDSPIITWDARTGAEREVCRPWGLVRTIVVSPDGRWIAAATGATGPVRIWNAGTGEMRTEHNVYSWSRADVVLCLAFSPDSERLAAGTDGGQVCVWERERAGARWSYDTLDSPVRSVAFSPSGRSLAARCESGKVRVWSHDEW